MPRYTAQSQSLFGNVGGPQEPRYRVDLPGALDSLASGASSLIHGAFTRHLAKQEMELRQQQLQRQEAHDQRMEANADRDFTARRDQEEWNRAHQTLEADRKFQTEGGTPGTPGGATVSIAPPPMTAPAPVGSIQSAMTRGFAPPPAPGTPLTTPSTLSQQLPKVQYGQEAPTPDTIDVTKSVQAQTATARANAAHAEKLADDERHVKDITGTKLPDGTVVTEQIARAIVANPGVARMFTRTPPAERAAAKAPGESARLQSTRKDLAEMNTQEVRAERRIADMRKDEKGSVRPREVQGGKGRDPLRFRAEAAARTWGAGQAPRERRFDRESGDSCAARADRRWSSTWVH
jgi:hypothetical protein